MTLFRDKKEDVVRHSGGRAGKYIDQRQELDSNLGCLL